MKPALTPFSLRVMVDTQQEITHSACLKASITDLMKAGLLELGTQNPGTWSQLLIKTNGHLMDPRDKSSLLISEHLLVAASIHF